MASKRGFEAFNGPILATTNCVPPRRITRTSIVFHDGVVGYEGAAHIRKSDGEKTSRLSSPRPSGAHLHSNGKIVGGFAPTGCSVLQMGSRAVKSERSRFVVAAATDAMGLTTHRSGWQLLDTVILTAGCAKYRYNRLQLGDIGILAFLDAGNVTPTHWP